MNNTEKKRSIARASTGERRNRGGIRERGTMKKTKEDRMPRYVREREERKKYILQEIYEGGHEEGRKHGRERKNET